MVALVGRPNVGKSTLFNRMCGARDALVADYPGLTRDRHYGRATLAGRDAMLIDTGGLTADFADRKRPRPEGADIFADMATQVALALDEANVTVLVADARDGLVANDQDIARHLRKRGKPVILAVNKMDSVRREAIYEFSALGLGEPWPVAAAHGRGVAALAEAVALRLPRQSGEGMPEPAGIRVAVAGRPNVGKSTLVNRLIGDERQVVYHQPGTTRDAIDIPFGGYMLIDTAGVRRKGRTMAAGADRTVETFSILKTLAALDRAQVAVLVVDGHEGIVDQDLHVLSYAIEAGAGILLAVNKWDGMDAAARTRSRASVDRRLAFAPWIPVRFVSALSGKGVPSLLMDVDAIHRAGTFDVKTADLNRILAAAVREHPPPTARSRPIKLRYVHKAGAHPPTLVVHGNQTEALPASYRRYLANRFRAELDLVGVPVRIETRTAENPFAGRRNEPSQRQLQRRKRLIRHRRGR